MDWPVLASLPPDERRRLVARLRRRTYPRDEVIFHQGDPAEALHLVATANQVLRRLVSSEIVAVSRSQIVVLNRRGLHQRAGQAEQV